MSNSKDFGFRAKTWRVQAEDELQMQQMLKRMKAAAVKIAGGAIVALGPQVWPFFWVEPTAQAQWEVEQLYQFHFNADGVAYLDIEVKSEWDFAIGGESGETITSSNTTATVIATNNKPLKKKTPRANSIGDYLARLNVRLKRGDGKTASLAFWFDLTYNHTVLRSVQQSRNIMIYSRKPNPTSLEDTPAIAVSFETALPELKEALDWLHY